MARLVDAAFWAVVCALAGCARPVIEDQPFGPGPDGSAFVDIPGNPEAGSAPNDGAALPAQDAGCSDGDLDGVCDVDDNCPAAANSDQADGDGDGVGDACSVVGLPCPAEALAQSITSGDAVLSGVSVNGLGSPVQVSAGAALTLQLDYAFAACGLTMTGQPRFLAFGFEGEATGDCQLLVDLPCPAAAAGSASLSLRAPTQTGLAYIVVAGHQGYTCSDVLSGSQRVAAVCVE
jgi:hypothetical protein